MTPEREKKMQQVIRRRQRDLSVVLENVADPHNISAVLRSCDAVGIQQIYILNTRTRRPKMGKKSSASARKWVDTLFFSDPTECVRSVRERHEKILSSHLGDDDSRSLYELELHTSVALVFGNEHDGVSEELRKLTDGNFRIPQMGMISSLNVSVACAVSLYEAYRQRAAAGMYKGGQIGEAEMAELMGVWEKK